MYKIGDVIKGKVSGIENYGVFISFADDFTGLIHISEMSDMYVKNVSDYVSLDEEIYVKVIDVIENEKKLKLTIKNIDYRGDGKVKSDVNGFSPLKDMLPVWISDYKKGQ